MKLRKWLKRLAFVLAALVTLAALLIAEENYRGKRAWDACQRELEAKGEKWDWQALIPPAVPDNQNFAKARAFAALLAVANTNSNTHSSLSPDWAWASYLNGGDWRAGRLPNLEQWQRKLRSTNISGISDPEWIALRARSPGTPVADAQFLFEQRAAEIAALRAAAQRPYASLDGETADVSWLLPRLALLKSLTLAFRASAILDLETGHPDLALADIYTLFALGKTAASKPLVIAGLVRIAISDLALQPVWCGLASHRWTDAQLAELATNLANVNIVADMQHCLRGERAYMLAMMNNGGSGTRGDTPHENQHSPEAESERSTQKAMQSLPLGFRCQSEVNIARAMQFLIEKFDPSGPTVKLTPGFDQEVKSFFPKQTLYNTLAVMLLPAVSKSVEKAANEQAAVSLARVACALERCRLATGSYPQKLDELAPRFIDRLPPDPVNGQPLHYRREAPDRFVLYSIGLNLKDDGGEVFQTKGGRLDWQRGDWVWRSDPVIEPGSPGQ
jgi:hypothetical protein